MKTEWAWSVVCAAINNARESVGLSPMNESELNIACFKEMQWRDTGIIEPKGPILTQRNGTNAINHPSHYGGADNIYEAIKVIDAWKVGFSIGNALKYICRAGKKNSTTVIKDLEKARWYLSHEIELLSSTTDTSNS